MRVEQESRIDDPQGQALRDGFFTGQVDEWSL